MVMVRLSLLLLCLTGVAHADYVLLKNGQRLRGEVVEEGDSEIVLLMPSVRARLARDKILRVIKEDNRRYYQSEGNKFLERGMYEDVVRFTKRGLERYKDAAELRTLSEVGGLLLEARKKVAELAFPAALELTKQARAKLESSKRVQRELESLESTHAYFAKNGSLPGDWMSLKRSGVRIVHHHPQIAKRLAKRVDELIKAKVLQYRASVSHKLPKEAVFVLMLYRNRDEFLAGMPDVKKYPQGLLPMTDGARLVTDTRAASYQGEAEKWLEDLASRYVLIQLYQLLPLWALEGLAAGGLDKQQDALRAAVNKQREAQQLTAVERLLAVRDLGQLDQPDQRARFVRQSTLFVHFLSRHSGGRYKLFKSFRVARMEMMKDIRLILKGKKKYKGSLRFENMFVVYVPKVLAKQFKHENLEALGKSFELFVRTGKVER